MLKLFGLSCKCNNEALESTSTNIIITLLLISLHYMSIHPLYSVCDIGILQGGMGMHILIVQTVVLYN